jgi:tRNA A37 threonylcarbamoyladenosine synthetase subunit TsaC/SUA5/YrdC
LQALLELHGAPLLATTLIPRGGSEAISDPQDITGALERELAVVIDAGACHKEPTTIIDLTPMGDGNEPIVIRQGRGDLAVLGL